MSTAAEHTVSGPGSWKMLRAMVGIGIMCALLIVLTFQGTLPRVERLKAEALERAVFQVLPGAISKAAYSIDEDGNITSGDGGHKTLYAGYDAEGNLIGIAIEASGMGYADIIRILYGYNPAEQAVIGFYVLESKETPGLGDKIEKDQEFLANFEKLDVSLSDNESGVKNLILTVKSGEKQQPWEIDGITGATISSRAIGKMLGESTQHWIPLIYRERAQLADPGTSGQEPDDE